jgi:predicted nucleic acid-binding protein
LDWAQWDIWSSVLIEVEVARVLDRLRLERRTSRMQLAALHGLWATVRTSMTLVPLRDEILATASAPMPSVVRTLDALHVASAVFTRDEESLPDLVFATHDRRQALAAEALGFDVIGL